MRSLSPFNYQIKKHIIVMAEGRATRSADQFSTAAEVQTTILLPTKGEKMFVKDKCDCC